MKHVNKNSNGYGYNDDEEPATLCESMVIFTILAICFVVFLSMLVGLWALWV